MKKLYAITFFLVVGWAARAQQYPLFSNYVTNSFGFNPALVGLEPGIEGRLVYRSQWSNFDLNPETSLGNINARLGKLPIGAGLTWYKDGAGRLNRNGATASLAVHRQLGGSTIVSVGGAFGYYQNRLTNEYFAQQMSDPVLAKAAEGKWAPDMNVGVYVQHKGLYAGLSAPQFIQRILNFEAAPDAQGQSVLVRHFYTFAGYKKYFGKMYLEPSVMLKMVNGAPAQWDAAAKVGTGTPLWLGLSYRNKAASAIMAGVDLNNGLGLAYAFDLTTSKLAQASQQSHELTLIYRLGKCKDTDGDGLCDKEDKCPAEPGSKELEGCPPEKKEKEDEKCLLDSDKDEICDKDDECPDVPGLKSNKGCPLDDKDRDGIPDDKDKCPDLPGFRQYEGCPMNDRDSDGLRDDLDKCPDEAGSVLNLGCPEGKGDLDGDGVPDEYDKCPNTAGTKQKNGCPEITDAEQDALDLAIENLYFDTDKWAIKPISRPHLDRLARVMVNQRGWKVRIAGHADARGTNEHNLMLSKNRAESVMYYLVARGVRREQLVVEYYGENVPVGDNVSSNGLSKNRRVELGFIFN